MERKDYTEANRQAWNLATKKHQQARKDELDKLFSKPGYTVTDKYEREMLEKIDIKGKNIIHLCCNNGIELLSLKNMGAGNCLGVDISDDAIQEAQNRAKKCKIDCDYIRSDVYDIPEKYYHQFDLVYITIGALGWMPDIDRFFNICADLLNENGHIFIYELHPFAMLVPEDANKTDERLKVIYPYFTDEPEVDDGGIDYIGKTEYKSPKSYWFTYTFSQIMTAMLENNLQIRHFREYEHDISNIYEKLETLNAHLPISYILIGQKLSSIPSPE